MTFDGFNPWPPTIDRMMRDLGFRKQVDLAEALEVDEDTISRWMTGRAQPRAANQRALAKLLMLTSYEWQRYVATAAYKTFYPDIVREDILQYDNRATLSIETLLKLYFNQKELIPEEHIQAVGSVLREIRRGLEELRKPLESFFAIARLISTRGG